MSNDSIARDVFGVSYETIIRRVVRTFDRANVSDIERGARWYDESGALAAKMALAHRGDGVDLERAASILAALSPRTTWNRNVIGAAAFLVGGPAAARRVGCMSANVERARHAKRDGFAALNGPKTNAFARNIAGDREAVTVDVWACRVADLDESLLSRKGAYDVVADAYRAAARRRGVDPATMQATTWIVSRGGRAS